MNKRRCHASIILEDSMKIIVALCILIFFQIKEIFKIFLVLRERSFTKALLVIVTMFLVLLIITARNYFVWRQTYIWIQDHSIIVERNTIFHKKNVYNIAYISNIDLEQNLFERMVRTSRIKIDTNSSVTASKTDIKILFSTKDANDFKQTILNETQINAADEKEHNEKNQIQQKKIVNTKTKEDQNSVQFSTKEVVRHVLVSVNPFTYLIIVGYFIAIILLLNNGFGNAKISHFWLKMVGGFAATFLAIGKIIYEKIKDVLRLYDFRIERNKDRFYLEYGFFNHVTKTIPLSKINAVIVKEPFLARLFGLYQIEIVNVGTGDEKEENRCILLSLPKNKIQLYMKTLLPEYEDLVSKKMTYQTKGYYLHYIYNAFIPSGVFLYILYYILVVRIKVSVRWYLVGGILFIFLVLVMMFFRFYTRAYDMEQHYIMVADGILTKETTLILYDKIQKLDISKKIPSRFTNLLEVECFIIGEKGKKELTLPLMTKEVADGFVYKVKEAKAGI